MKERFYRWVLSLSTWQAVLLLIVVVAFNIWGLNWAGNILSGGDPVIKAWIIGVVLLVAIVIHWLDEKRPD